MTEAFALRALLFAGECLAASVLLLAGAAVVTRFLKHASLRHLVWLTAFGTMLVLPAAALVVPSQIAIHRSVTVEQPAPSHLALGYSSAASLPMMPPARAPSWNITAADVALALFALWLMGFAWNALRLLAGAIGINALQISSTRVDDQSVAGLARARGCDVRLAGEGTGPMTWGTLRPVILLPNSALSWPPERLRAVLLHELAHVDRRDSLAQAVSRVAGTLYWPNPLVWLGARAMRRDAEIAADDAVIGAGIRPSAYANELLGIARDCRGQRFAFASGLSMASEAALATRLKSVLTNQSRRGVTLMDVAKIAGVGLVVTVALALVRPSFADETAPAAKAAPSAAAVAAVPPAPPIVAENELPPPPPPPAPPAPDVAPAPPVPPVPPADTHYQIDMHGDLGDSMRDMHAAIHRMTPRERRELHHILHNLHHEIHDAMAKARPEMARAMAELQAHREELKNLRPQLEQAMRDAKPDMDRAMAEMRAHREELKALKPQIEQAMREARPEIERAMAEAHEALAKAHVDERVRRHIEQAMQHIEMHMDRHGDSDGDADAMQHGAHDRDMHESDEEDSGDQDNDHP
jgi:beta-lactamase regulating signal transducer with metallopeptidase domain